MALPQGRRYGFLKGGDRRSGPARVDHPSAVHGRSPSRPVCISLVSTCKVVPPNRESRIRCVRTGFRLEVAMPRVR
eukprot:6756890-Pyramimonas_sp.AAC.1